MKNEVNSIRKVFVNDSDKAMIIGPMCGFMKEIDVTNLKNTQKKLKIKCKCNEIFKIILEFRKHYRKKVRLSGECAIKGKGERGKIVSRNLSLTGIQFESLNTHKIKLDDILEIKFKLDNPRRSEIYKLAKVKCIRDRIIGAQYTQQKQFDKNLGFYLKT